MTTEELRLNIEKALDEIRPFLQSDGGDISLLSIEDDKLVSLRGTLVPATTLNKIIGSIPLLGDILVGKKVGEGVFGVSFKIKGPPKDLKTTVNPIKTLTPRFITRTLEKIKKTNRCSLDSLKIQASNNNPDVFKRIKVWCATSGLNPSNEGKLNKNIATGPKV